MYDIAVAILYTLQTSVV